MGLISMFLLACSLAMDASAVSISSGISSRAAKITDAIKMAFFFGLFQFVMPVIGFFLTGSFYEQVCRFDHWIAFGLLTIIGGKMILEAFKKDDCDAGLKSVKFKELIVLSFATSIDALAAGVGLSFLCTSVFLPASIIGIVTFVFSFLGFVFGKKLGCRFGKKMEMAGGAVLIILGSKILAEAYGFI